MSPSRGLLTATHSFAALARSALPTQIYLSRSTNPHINLSLEHHLFTTLPPASRTLVLYINSPCIVIGRNQNPWLETAHSILLRTSPAVQLLRRRSGGGTVFHDLGNVNYSVTVPTETFNRDTHAHLIVRALRTLGVPSAAVNARHDIVVSDKKVSGSAYKLTRKRSYHHGTMLLDTDLSRVSALLKCPAKNLIEARGVASVPSPVTNVHVPVESFISEVVGEFATLYGDAGIAEVEEEEAAGVDGVMEGVRELSSQEWVYGQTPKFTLTTPVGEVVVEKGAVV